MNKKKRTRMRQEEKKNVKRMNETKRKHETGIQ